MEEVLVLLLVLLTPTGDDVSLASTTIYIDATAGGRRRSACSGCVPATTRVRVGDFATFRGSYGVSGTATVVASNLIRVTNMRHDGSAPGLQFRIGLAPNRRQDFVVLSTPGRQRFDNATIDLVLPASVSLDSFDTFTVWCYEFPSIIAEGKFRR